jgi:monoamine oxidase
MRTPLFRSLIEHFRIAQLAEERRISAADAIAEWSRTRGRVNRRRFLQALSAGAVAATAGSRFVAAQSNVRVGVVGAGLAGLACADRLAQRGIAATVFEASTRPGGRCHSLRGHFPGQVAERGGELIDNLHKTMLGFAKRFRLTLEDYEKQPGDVFYRFDGQPWPEEIIVDEYRAFVAAMRDDLRGLSPEPTADNHTDADVALDRMPLAEYLASRNAGPVLTRAISAAYLAEYGLEPDRQSSLNFLFFIHADKRSRFMPFGVFSDERYHVVEGNDRIVEGLASGLPAPVRYSHLLRRVARTPAGRVELTFSTGGRSASASFDYVIIALPFTVLREVELADSLQLPDWKLHAIRELGYGTNAKMMIGFDGAYWRALGSSGASYSDLPNHQTTWETNPTAATSTHAVLTDYAAGDRGARLNPGNVQFEAQRFLNDLDFVFPGAQAFATRGATGYRVHLEHWPSNPLAKGSYTCYMPGQFTSIAGNEGKRVGNLFFAGEHTNSFYDWQGFMEGACLSGIAAANGVLADVKKR